MDIYKMHFKETNIKKQSLQLFDYLIIVKKLETKNILTDEKYRKHLVIWL